MVEVSKRGALAAASAAPRGNASWGSIGAMTGTDTRSCKYVLTWVTSTFEPTTNMLCGAESSASRLATISASTAIASASCRLWFWLSTRMTEPSAVSTTTSVAASRLTEPHSDREFRQPPRVCASRCGEDRRPKRIPLRARRKQSVSFGC
jgi:hypothetical protein